MKHGGWTDIGLERKVCSRIKDTLGHQRVHLLCFTRAHSRE